LIKSYKELKELCLPILEKKEDSPPSYSEIRLAKPITKLGGLAYSFSQPFVLPSGVGV